MRRRLTGTVCILLVLTLLCAGASASAEPPVQQITAPGLPVGAAPAGLPSMPETLEEDTWAQAMSVGMTCWNSYTDRINLWEPYFA